MLNKEKAKRRSAKRHRKCIERLSKELAERIDQEIMEKYIWPEALKVLKECQNEQAR